MNWNWTRPLVGGALVALTIGAAALPADAAGPGLYHYSAHADVEVVENISADDSPCGQAGVATMQLRMNVAVAATVAGLSNDEVLALVAADPDGLVRQIAMVSTGDIVIEMGGHTYTGRVTQRFDGRFLPNGMYLQSGSISMTGRSELGTHVSISAMGHDVDGFDGTTKHAFSRGRVVGCL